MNNTKHLEIHKQKEQTAAGVNIAAGGSKVLGEDDLGEQVSELTFGYVVATVLGSVSVELQACVGQDINGNDIWVTEGSSTNPEDSLSIDRPVDKVRLKVFETGGTSGLEDINVFKYTRSI